MRLGLYLTQRLPEIKYYIIGILIARYPGGTGSVRVFGFVCTCPTHTICPLPAHHGYYRHSSEITDMYLL